MLSKCSLYFRIKDLDKLKYFLGLEIAHSTSGISLCQRDYCLDLINDFGLLNFKPVSTPFDPNIKLHHDSSTPYPDVPTYRRKIVISKHHKTGYHLCEDTRRSISGPCST